LRYVTGWLYFLWGLFGGFAIEGLDFATAIRRVGDWPWRDPAEPAPAPLVVSVLIHTGIGGGLAAAAGVQGQVTGPVGAIAIGVAAPLLIAQMRRWASTDRAVKPQTEESGSDSGRDLEP